MALSAATSEHDIRHVVAYRPPEGKYAGWPANYGMWIWGQEIVVVFTQGSHDPEGRFHARSRSEPFVTLQARSLNGGVDWETGPLPARTPGGRGLSADEHMDEQLHVAKLLQGNGAPVPPGAALDFSGPDFALMCARTNLHAGSRSWFYVSNDRCRSWEGPYALPMFGTLGISARTDYLIDGANRLTLFLTSTKSDGREGRVFCARTTDGGRNFEMVSWLGAERKEGFEIMPASVRLSPRHIVTAVRCREPDPTVEGGRRDWIDLYDSLDDGNSWRNLATPVRDTGAGGNPPALIRLADGRLCLVYGFRSPPQGLRAVLSSDQGRTWSEPIVLRSDGGSHDIGYPRAVQRADGTLVITYYYNDAPRGAGYIAATLWRP